MNYYFTTTAKIQPQTSKKLETQQKDPNHNQQTNKLRTSTKADNKPANSAEYPIQDPNFHKEQY